MPRSRWCLRLLYITITYFALAVVISDGAVVSNSIARSTDHDVVLSDSPYLLTKRSPQIPEDEYREDEYREDEYREDVAPVTSNESIRELDPTGSIIFNVAGIITSIANMLGSSLMIYLTIRKNRHNSEPLSPSKRFPLYMAIMDFGASIVTLPNLFYPLENGYLMSGNLCTSLGFMTSLLILMNMMLMASLAIITYLRICKRYVVKLGKKDWILFVSILIPTSTFSSVTLLLGGFGPDTYWCFMNHEESGSRLDLIALIIFACVVTVLTSFCYMRVIKRVHDVEAMLTSASFTKSKKTSEKTSNKQEIQKMTPPQLMIPAAFKTKSKHPNFGNTLTLPPEISSTTSSEYTMPTMNGLDGLEIRPPSFFCGPQPTDHDVVTIVPTASQKRTVTNIAKATRKMSSYIFLQLIQYIPIIIYSLCFLLNQMQTWVYVLTIVMLNLGGVTKSLTFMKNEILCNNGNGKKKKLKARLNDNFSKSFGSDDINSCDNQSKERSVPFISVTYQQEDYDNYFNLENFDYDNIQYK